MRKWSNLLTKKYIFKRFLETCPELLASYKAIENLINKVEPLRPNEDNSETVWPRRIQFPEQILAVEELEESAWIVTSEVANKTIGENAPYKQKINIEITIQEIKSPKVVEISSPYGYLYHVRSLEHKEVKDGDVLRGAEESTGEYIMTGKNREGFVSLKSCNILPMIERRYSAAFYDKTVANNFAESLDYYITKVLKDRRR